MLEQKDVLDYDTDGNTTELTRSYYHRNALGSVIEITDANQVVVVSYRYDPYGRVTITRGGQTQNTDPLGQHWVFTGRFNDEETGLYYYRARYYDAEIGRFLQRDPLLYSLSPNPFLYAESRPLDLRDPTGEAPDEVGFEHMINEGLKFAEASGFTITSGKACLLAFALQMAALMAKCDCGVIEIKIRGSMSGAGFFGNIIGAGVIMSQVTKQSFNPKNQKLVGGWSQKGNRLRLPKGAPFFQAHGKKRSIRLIKTAPNCTEYCSAGKGEKKCKIKGTYGGKSVSMNIRFNYTWDLKNQGGACLDFDGDSGPVSEGGP